MQPSLLERIQNAERAVYRCPGEPGPISRAVHLSRLAAFYPKCRTCPAADDARSLVPLPQPYAGVAEPGTQRPPRTVGVDGVRGVYLNEIARPRAESIALAAAAVLWSDSRRHGRVDDDLPLPPAAAPTVVVGRDGRPSSADIARGVVRGILRMGGHVIDVGPISRPGLDFAVYHLRATAGLHVTGAGCGPAATGMDLVDSRGVPWSSPGRLDQLHEVMNRPPARPTRRGGVLRSCDVRLPWHVERLRHRQGLRQIRVGLHLECPLQRAAAAGCFQDVAASIVPVPHLSNANAAGELPADLRRELRRFAQAEHLQFFARVDDDGRRLHLWDERLRPVDAADWLVRLAERMSHAGPARFVVSQEAPALARGRLKAHGAEVILTEPVHEALVRTLLQAEASFAADGLGRLWLADHYPVCDGLVTLMHLMRLASESSGPVSHWAVQ